jgi:plastocyanin
MKGLSTPPLVLSTLGGALLLAGLTLLPAPPAMADSWRAVAGVESHGEGKQALAFLPNEMWIHAGDSVTWSLPTHERHTVTFLLPGQVRQRFQVGCPGSTPDGSTYDGSACVNSDVLMDGQTYTVTFPKPGNFKLTCLVHVYMTGVVHVLGAALPLPHDQDYYDDEARAEQRKLLADASRLKDRAEAIARRTSDTEVSAGIAEVVATTGGGLHGSSVMRFLRDRIVVHVGDTVEWTNLSPGVSHTVTFGTPPADDFAPPSSGLATDADGTLHGVVGSPADNVHSGLFGPAPAERQGIAQAPAGAPRFRVTFTAPGVFPYLCTLHDEQGMVGKVVVLP